VPGEKYRREKEGFGYVNPTNEGTRQTGFGKKKKKLVEAREPKVIQLSLLTDA
jgi:hypothetical protein